MTTPQLDDFWTEGDTGVAILADPPTLLDREPDVTIFDPDLGERVPMVPRLGDSLTRRFGIDAWTNAPSNTLSAGVVPVNQIPARHLQHGPITIG